MTNTARTNLSAAAQLAIMALTLMLFGPSARSDDSRGEVVSPVAESFAKATFAGGCFWCMEAPFDELDGVLDTKSGYTGGDKGNPTYREVSAGRTGHAEAIQILFDPAKISYETLLEVFWRNIDPTAADRQFCDVGSQYRSGIFYHDEEQKYLAERSREALTGRGTLPGPVVTEITEAGTFYPAEEYHQDYYLKNPVRYKMYRKGCGRDRRLQELWGDSH